MNDGSETSKNGTETANNYVIVGPNEDDGDGLPTFWSNDAWGWVAFEQATRFNCNILRAYPLPVGSRYILDVRTIETHWHTMTLSPMGAEDNPVDVLIQQYHANQPLLNKIRMTLRKLRKTFDKF